MGQDQRLGGWLASAVQVWKREAAQVRRDTIWRGEDGHTEHGEELDREQRRIDAVAPVPLRRGHFQRLLRVSGEAERD